MLSKSLFSQLNLVLNSEFDDYLGFSGTNVLPIDAASNWKGYKSADLYLRDSIDKHGNVVRIAPYLNEGLSGNLKRGLYENEEYVLKFDLYCSKKEKLLLDFFLSNSQLDSIEHKLIKIKTKRKKWITYSYKMTSNIFNDRFSLISSTSKQSRFVIFIDNIEIIVKGYENDLTYKQLRVK